MNTYGERVARALAPEDVQKRAAWRNFVTRTRNKLKQMLDNHEVHLWVAPIPQFLLVHFRSKNPTTSPPKDKLHITTRGARTMNIVRIRNLARNLILMLILTQVQGIPQNTTTVDVDFYEDGQRHKIIALGITIAL